MRTEIIDTWPAFSALEGHWNGLLRQSRADTIFLTWEWIQAWREVVGHRSRPFAVTVRDESNRLIGVAPFCFGHYRLLATVPYRILRVMADYPTGAEYGDWIVHIDHEKEVARRIGAALRDHRKEWDCIWMPNMAGWTGAHERIASVAMEEGFSVQMRQQAFGYMRLPKGMVDYERALSGDRRQQIRRIRKKILSRDGAVVSCCGALDELPKYLQALFDLHFRRWQIKGQDGSFRRKPDEARFYESFAPLALKAGWLRIFALEENSAIKAVQLGYVYKGTFHQMQEGFDPDFVPGAGNVLRHQVIEACILEGLEAYDFLGEMSEHKRRWQAVPRKGYHALVAHRSAKNRILLGLGIWPTGRYFRPEQGQAAKNAGRL